MNIKQLETTIGSIMSLINKHNPDLYTIISNEFDTITALHPPGSLNSYMHKVSVLVKSTLVIDVSESEIYEPSFKNLHNILTQNIVNR